YTVEDCLEFYRTYYAPNNATVCVVGDVDVRDAVGAVKEAYGAIARSRIPATRNVAEPHLTEERRARISRPTPSPRLLLAYRGAPYAHRDHAVLQVVLQILSGGRSSRLHRALVVDAQHVSDVGGFLPPFADAGLLEFNFTLRPGRTTRQVLGIYRQELERLAREGPTEKELEAAKNRLELAFYADLETASGRADQMGFGAVVTGDPHFGFHRDGEHRSVTPGDVRRALAQYILKRKATRVDVVPSRRQASGGQG
ncbi:MAG: insulinase family protein, partial [Myxococcales bacterium]|nr:insulinase family protein [Myxococcales bacterium]